MDIKEISVEELPSLEGLANEFFSESGISGKFSMARFKETWTSLIDDEIGRLFVAFDDGMPVGAIGGVVTPDPNTEDLVAMEAFWFVRPAFRGKTGLKLLRLFEGWSKEMGAARVYMAHLDNSGDKVKNLYASLGYKPFETYYLKDL